MQGWSGVAGRGVIRGEIGKGELRGARANEGDLVWWVDGESESE